MNNKFLIIVAPQNGFFDKLPEGSHLTRNSLRELCASGEYNKIIVTKFNNFDGSPYEEFLNWNAMHCGGDIEIIKELQDYIDYTIVHTTYNAVDTAALTGLNDGKIPSEVYVAGLDTDACVLATAFELFDSGICPKILTKYCASPKQECHEAALTLMRRNFGKDNVI